MGETNTKMCKDDYCDWKVEGIVDVRCGENFSKFSQGYTHAYLILAKDKPSWERYQNHPDRTKIVKLIDALDHVSIGVDFED